MNGVRQAKKTGRWTTLGTSALLSALQVNLEVNMKTTDPFSLAP